MRFRVTLLRPGVEEQTWVILPDEPSARMQAEEQSLRERETEVRVYREAFGGERQLLSGYRRGKPVDSGTSN